MNEEDAASANHDNVDYDNDISNGSDSESGSVKADDNYEESDYDSGNDKDYDIGDDGYEGIDNDNNAIDSDNDDNDDNDN
jgi:hypothetical protein